MRTNRNLRWLIELAAIAVLSACSGARAPSGSDHGGHAGEAFALRPELASSTSTAVTLRLL